MSKHTLQRWLPWVILTLLAIPALWPYTHGWPDTADGTLHLLRTSLLDVNVKRGLLYPRWLSELVLGYGYPVFSFYGPATFYVAEVLHLLGLGYYHAVMATQALLVVGASWGMYLLARDSLGERHNGWAALLAAVAYLYCPYLLLNVFVRGAIGEIGAQALLPWIFWSFRRLLTQPRPERWVLPAALSLGAMAVTHNITLIFLPAVLLTYLALLWWRGGFDRARLAWTVTAGLASMGLSAFFWLPLITERQYLSENAYRVSAQIFIPENVWTWRNFLDTGFPYTYNGAIPFQLGLVQAMLGLGGFILARRRDAEWVFWLGLAVAAGLGMGEWAKGIWLSNDILKVAQFPWRLLTFVGLALALLTGGLAQARRNRAWAVGAGLAGIGLLIAANRPYLPLTQFQPTDNDALGLTSVAQFEYETEALGTSSSREFMPRWVDGIEVAPRYLNLPSDEAVTVQVERAGPYAFSAVVSSPAATELRFTDFYYPSWQVRLDGQAAPQVGPSTNIGLLTVAVPAGTHRLEIRWQNPPVQFFATLIGLLTLMALTLFSLRQVEPRWLALVPLALLVFGAVATFKPLPAPPFVPPPTEPLEVEGVQLLGLRTERFGAEYMYIFPYWHVHATPTRLQARWQLRDSSGNVVTENVSQPYFSTSQSDNWPAATVVDDAYRLTLPPGLSAGDYSLWLAVEPAYTEAAMDLVHVGAVQLAGVPPLRQAAPAQAVDAVFGGRVRLAGYDLRINGRAASLTEPMTVVRPGDLLAYTLHWQPLRPVNTNYHGLVHLLNAHQVDIAQRDQLAGSWFGAPLFWDLFRLNRDTYILKLPENAAGGVYWPHVGLYPFDTMARMPVTNSAGEDLGDTLSLAPLKVLPQRPPAPQHAAAVRFDDVATLLGYDLDVPDGGVRAGASVTLTVYYRSEQATSADYTRFVHIFSAEQGMAGQADSPPQQGVNPTWSWQPGEVIVDQIVVPLAAEAAPGVYTIRLGLYDPGANGARLTVYDQDGNPQPDGIAALTELSLEP